MKKILTTVLLFLGLVLSAQQVFYTEDNKIIANPERGLYYYTTGDSDNFVPLNQTELVNLRVNNKVTLVWRTYYMNAYINSIIPETYLNNIQNDLNKARLSGVKLILRFAYNESNIDANKARILGHINQLKPVLNSNQDVISSLEAGFIGSYGEWYDSSNFGNTDNLTSAQAANRLEIGNKIFELCPLRHIAFRTPLIMRSITGTNAMLNTQAYQGTNLSRMGFHNDCFLRTGWEGYTNTTSEYPYLAQQTKYTISGGETCGLISPSTDCTNALLMSKQFHFNYLNMSYHPDVWQTWQSGGCSEEIQKNLGYRFVLLSSDLDDTSISIHLLNKGFGNLVNKRDAYLVYKNVATGQEFSEILNTNPWFWESDNVNGILVFHNINTTLPNGQYRLYLNLPDRILINNPLYSIRCSNMDLWEESTGYNNLNQTVIINNLGLNNLSSASLSITPNPTNNNLTISGIDMSDYKFKVFNILGQSMRVTRNDNFLNTSGLKPGVYMLKIYNKTENKTIKFIKE